MKNTFTRYRQTATLAMLAFATTLAGCTMAPKHERPASPTAMVYPSETPTISGVPDAADIGWRDFFHDPLLQELIAIALRNNRDLRKAGLNVEAARRLYRIQRAEMLPNLNASAALDVGRVPADLSVTDAPEINRRYEVTGATTAWELDLWGRVRSLSDQALAAYMALDETRIATQISLVSEVASAWLTLRADRELRFLIICCDIKINCILQRRDLFRCHLQKTFFCLFRVTKLRCCFCLFVFYPRLTIPFLVFTIW